MTTGDRGILSRVKEDMEVYDVNGEHVGEVEWVYLGEASQGAIDAGTGPRTVSETGSTADTFVDVVARAFDDDDLPDTVRSRLLMNGFIRIDADGLFAADRFVMPDQIASVSGDRVMLNVRRDELIRD